MDIGADISMGMSIKRVTTTVLLALSVLVGGGAWIGDLDRSEKLVADSEPVEGLVEVETIEVPTIELGLALTVASPAIEDDVPLQAVVETEEPQEEAPAPVVESEPEVEQQEPEPNHVPILAPEPPPALHYKDALRLPTGYFWIGGVVRGTWARSMVGNILFVSPTVSLV